MMMGGRCNQKTLSIGSYRDGNRCVGSGRVRIHASQVRVS
jgi:hypothetical protein